MSPGGHKVLAEHPGGGGVTDMGMATTLFTESPSLFRTRLLTPELHPLELATHSDGGSF